jgi:hypothetical protein
LGVVHVGRVLVGAAVLAVVLLAVALAMEVVAPGSGWALPLLIVSGVMFAAVVWAIFARAWRTKGWSVRDPGRFDDRTPLE